MTKGLRTAGVALLFLAASLALAVFAASLLGLPARDLPAVALLLAVAGGGSGLLALLLIRPAVLGRLGGVRAQLVGAGLIGSLLLLGMMLAGARAMFISGHDLSLLLTMLTFAAALSVGFGLLYAMPLSSRIERVRAGTARIAEGELESEVPVEGQDEVGDLAEDFNQMARALREASEREREMEEARRDLIAAVSHDLRTPLASDEGPDRGPRGRRRRGPADRKPLPLLGQPRAGAPEPPGRRPLRARQDRCWVAAALAGRGLTARPDLRHHLELPAAGRTTGRAPGRRGLRRRRPRARKPAKATARAPQPRLQRPPSHPGRTAP